MLSILVLYCVSKFVKRNAQFALHSTIVKCKKRIVQVGLTEVVDKFVVVIVVVCSACLQTQLVLYI